jgi:hypothetical protein
MVKTAIVILNWNGLSFLKLFLSQVIEHSSDHETLICVADNGSTDSSADWVAENFSDIKLIRLEKNYGFAGGYNLALQQIEARYFVLLNSDVQVTQGWLNPMLDYMDANPDVASCQPKILSFERRDHFEYAGAAGGFIDKYGFTFCRGRIFEKMEKDAGQYDTISDIFWSSGACMMVRAEAYAGCGGLDTDFFAHMEEIDLCWRFHNAGYRVVSTPCSVVYHVGGGTLPYSSPFKTFLNFRNNLYLLYKNLPENQLYKILFFRRILDGLALIRFMLKGRVRSAISIAKAHLDYYSSLGKLREKRKQTGKKGEMQNDNLIMNKCIVFEFYIKGCKTFSSLSTKST